MNTDISYIEIDQGKAEATPVPVGFVRSHRVALTLLTMALAAGVALTSCFAVRSHYKVAPQPPAKDLEFKMAKERPWLPTKAAPAKHTPASAAFARADRQNFQLTFDDGPNPTHTPPILDWLKANQLHATFFVVGANAVRYPELVKRIIAEGHQIGNHSWSHPNLKTMSDTAVRSQLQRTHDAIVKACGVAPKAFRPPYGSISPRQRAWIQKEFGYKTVFWDIDTGDWKPRTTSAIAATIQHGIKSKGPHVILAHDIHPRILPALESLMSTRLDP